LRDPFRAAAQTLANQIATGDSLPLALRVGFAIAVRLLPNTRRRPASTSDTDP
jgi:hypothetical protein